MKFGGSSLATADRILYVARLIKAHVDVGYRPVVVCSAMGKTTNALLAAGDLALQGSVQMDSLRTLHEVAANTIGVSNTTRESIHSLLHELDRLLSGVCYVGEISPRTSDHLVSFGERLCVRIVAAALNSVGVPAQYFDSWQVGFKTTSSFGNADVLESSFSQIGITLTQIDESMVPVVTGFIGHDEKGRITTLGRGGSDLTASVLGASIGADEIQVWKDVDGIMTANPKLVPTALPVDCVSFEEASELAYFGAEVLHPLSMVPAMRTNIPVRVKNSYNPRSPGTVILAERDKSNSLVTAITSKSGVQLIDIVSTRMLGQHGFMSTVFDVFRDCQMSVDVVATSEVSISLTLDKKQRAKGDQDKLLKMLGEFSEVKIKDDRAIISLIANVDRSSEVMAMVFAVLMREDIRVEMLSQGASKVNISLVVDADHAQRAVRALHECFFEGRAPNFDVKTA